MKILAILKVKLRVNWENLPLSRYEPMSFRKTLKGPGPLSPSQKKPVCTVRPQLKRYRTFPGFRTERLIWWVFIFFRPDSVSMEMIRLALPGATSGPGTAARPHSRGRPAGRQKLKKIDHTTDWSKKTCHWDIRLNSVRKSCSIVSPRWEKLSVMESPIGTYKALWVVL